MGSQREIEHEERAIYIVIGLACLPVLIAALVQGGALDAGASISLLLVFVALFGLLRLATKVRRRHRLPLARARHSASAAASRSR